MGLLFDVTQVESALEALRSYTYPCIEITPTILISKASSRAYCVAEYSKLLDDIDETHSALVRLEAQLKDVDVRLQQRRGAVSTALAPVTGLPTELLHEIFSQVAASDRSSKARIRLSHVSSTWRAASLGLKELWTVIEVPEGSTDMVHEFAARSGDLRLELYRLPGTEWPEDLELTSNEASRILAMSSAPFDGAGAVFRQSLVKQSTAMHLDTLIVSGPDQFIIGGMASAKTLRVCKSTVHHNGPIRMERLLELFADSILVTDVSGLTGSLQAPLLQHLTFTRIWISMEPLRFPPEGEEWEYLEMLRARGLFEEDDDGFANFEDQMVEELTRPFPQRDVASQATSLVLDRCHCSFVMSIFGGWEMSNLTSLTLVLSTDRDSDQISLQYWRSREGITGTRKHVPHFHPEFFEFVRRRAVYAI